MLDELQPVALINDQPILSGTQRPDRLGFKPFAETLARVALGTDGPFTIGLYGGWGVGKTSMLRYVKTLVDKQFENRQDAVAVWFNPWQYECEDDPVFALIAAIIRALPNNPIKWLDEVGKALRALAYGLSFEVGGEGAKAKLDGSKAMNEAKALAEGPLAEKIAYQKAFDLLEGCSKFVRDGRIVVFIDDLDRCQPDTALKVLESMKLVFGQRGFIFLLGLDNEIIEGYLTHAYKQDLDLVAPDGDNDTPYRHLAARYFHKLVQMEFPLPSHVPEKFDSYLRALTESDVSEGQRDDLVKILRLGAAVNPRSAVRLVNRLRLQVNLWQAISMATPEGVDSEQIPLLMAFSNVLLDRLGPRRFEQLANDQKMCDAFLPAREGVESTSQPGLAETSWQVVESLRKEQDTLGPLYATDIARLWLMNGELRKAMHAFFQKTEVISEVPEAQREIVDRALRNALGLSTDAPIPKVKRKDVTRLDLSLQADLTDAGLAYLKDLTGLQILSLSGTQVSNDGLVYLKDLTRLKELSLSCTQVSDAGLVYLKGFTDLERLILEGPQVTDNGLAHLKNLNHLQGLYISGSQISNDGLRHLKDLTELHWLSLSGTPISNEGLKHLAAFTNLRWLYLTGTKVSGYAVEALRKQLPNCHIAR